MSGTDSGGDGGTGGGPLGLDPDLLALVVCPACHGSLAPEESAGELVCTGCGLAYPVRDGIPVLLVDEARPRD